MALNRPPIAGSEALIATSADGAHASEGSGKTIGLRHPSRPLDSMRVIGQVTERRGDLGRVDCRGMPVDMFVC